MAKQVPKKFHILFSILFTISITLAYSLRILNSCNDIAKSIPADAEIAKVITGNSKIIIRIKLFIIITSDYILSVTH